jgi:hypothetical protein
MDKSRSPRSCGAPQGCRFIAIHRHRPPLVHRCLQLPPTRVMSQVSRIRLCLPRPLVGAFLSRSPHRFDLSLVPSLELGIGLLAIASIALAMRWMLPATSDHRMP